MNDEIEFYINENGIACVPLKMYNDSLEKIERLKEYQESYRKELDFWRMQFSNKEEIIDNALEYINEHLEVTEYGEIKLTHTFDKHNLKELKDILQGSDKE